MGSTYRLWLEANESIEIEAQRFEIEEDGILVFYEEPELPDGATLKDIQEEYPFAAYKEWNSVIEKWP